MLLPLRRRVALGIVAVALATAPALAAASDPARTASEPAPAPEGPSHPEVLIVVNGRSPVSVAIGERYRRARNVPASNVLALPLSGEDPSLATFAGEVTTREFFVSAIRDPIAAFLKEHDLADRIRILVLAKGVPLRISGPNVPMATLLRDTRVASVDAELAILSSGRDGAPGIGGMANPYYDSDQDFAAFRADHPDAPLRYLVARLDGHALPLDAQSGVPADVLALIDGAQAKAPQGKWLIDEDATKHGGLAAGNRAILRPTAAILQSLGLAVRHEGTATFVSNARDLAGYASWGSNDDGDKGKPFYGRIGGAVFPGAFLPRSIATDLVSTSARTFAVEPVEWEQSLVADLIHLGASGAAGNVFEPTLAGCARAPILFRRYAEGVPAAEAHARSVPYLGWMNVWIGDPLMTIPEPVTRRPADLDGDGAPDAQDDCLELPNADQRDTDGDGIGNLCDADLDGDGVVSTSWGVISPPDRAGDLERIVLTWKRGGYDPNQDLDGDRKVDENDVGLAQLWLGLPPGPSGREEQVRNARSAGGP